MIIVGIGGTHSDAACAVLRDGAIAAAAEERKVARRYTEGDLPEHSLQACLAAARVQPVSVDCVALVRPFPERLNTAIRNRFPNARLALVEHHTAHAASAYYPSEFHDATVLTLDRGADFRCGARWFASGTTLEVDREMYVPDSLAELYSRVTELLGFEPHADEHKVQWLSTSGDDRYASVFDEILAGDWPQFDRTWFNTEGRSRFQLKVLPCSGTGPRRAGSRKAEAAHRSRYSAWYGACRQPNGRTGRTALPCRRPGNECVARGVPGA